MLLIIVKPFTIKGADKAGSLFPPFLSLAFGNHSLITKPVNVVSSLSLTLLIIVKPLAIMGGKVNITIVDSSRTKIFNSFMIVIIIFWVMKFECKNRYCPDMKLISIWTSWFGYNHCFKYQPIYRYIGWDTGIFIQNDMISVKFYRISFWTDMGRYVTKWPIYLPISEMKIYDILPRDAFEELLQMHLRNFYKR